MLVPNTLKASLRALGFIVPDYMRWAADPFASLVESIETGFTASAKTDEDQAAMQAAVLLVSKFDWEDGDHENLVFPVCGSSDPAVQAALDEVFEYMIDAAEIIRFPSERARQPGVAPDGPPAKVMRIKNIELEPQPEIKPQAPKPETHPPEPRERGEGRRYNEARDVKDIAKLVRQELLALSKKGKIPKFKYSIRISRFSGGQSISVVIRSTEKAQLSDYMNLPIVLTEEMQGYGYLPHGDQFSRYKPKYNALEKLIESKLNDFNHDRSDSQTDYFNVRFYLHVSVDHASEKAVKDQVIGAFISVVGEKKPLFDAKTYRDHPEDAVRAYADILAKAGYSAKELKPA